MVVKQWQIDREVGTHGTASPLYGRQSPGIVPGAGARQTPSADKTSSRRVGDSSVRQAEQPAKTPERTRVEPFDPVDQIAHGLQTDIGYKAKEYADVYQDALDFITRQKTQEKIQKEKDLSEPYRGMSGPERFTDAGPQLDLPRIKEGAKRWLTEMPTPPEQISSMYEPKKVHAADKYDGLRNLENRLHQHEDVPFSERTYRSKPPQMYAPQPKLPEEPLTREEAYQAGRQRETIQPWSREKAYDHMINSPYFTPVKHHPDNPFWPNPSNPEAEGNCTWYAHGRLRELGADPRHLLDSNDMPGAHASAWAEKLKNKSPDNVVNKIPTAGAIAQWDSKKGGYGNEGHVGVVERVYYDNNGKVTGFDMSHSGYTMFDRRGTRYAVDRIDAGTQRFKDANFIHIPLRGLQ